MKHTSVRMPTALKLKVAATIKRQGYGGRGKSKWAREAIAQLFEEDPGLINVGVGDGLEDINDRDVYYLDKPTRDLVIRGIELLRLQSPLLEGVQSSIIRAALRYRVNRVDTRRKKSLSV